jgi:SAM-dependent methyltransferase
VGCFTGDFLELLQYRGADVYGLELQSQAVEIANRKLPGRIFQADLYGSDLAQMHFDVVTLMGVIEHVIDPMKLLDRAVKFLSPGGWIMLQTPNSASCLARLMRGLWPPYAPIEHIHLFSRKSLETALKRLGFQSVTFKSHVKTLPIVYVYGQMQNFGPEWHRLLNPIYRLLPRPIINARLPFYIGEMVVTAYKR